MGPADEIDLDTKCRANTVRKKLTLDKILDTCRISRRNVSLVEHTCLQLVFSLVSFYGIAFNIPQIKSSE